MGQNVANIEFVTDYTPDTSFLRIHMDIPIPPSLAGRLRLLLDARKFNAARELVISANPDLRNVDMLNAAFTELASIRQNDQTSVTPFRQA